ncbi:Arylsulfatase [Pontiella desulfatans]|uniref:Arylsulfatase n=1 Tax=Pontiella desulfatans TaxID=2750659 RepID=A0A6C2U5H6_PONDE|nr:sulfatase-like hydrolase/transferase [Pontiella desulfatans]SPS73948.1 sulfatase S1_40 [Kiritimatiellales bacterium]VGO15089.1 Arylsulfatase [Pontiella desulfatans]
MKKMNTKRIRPLTAGYALLSAGCFSFITSSSDAQADARQQRPNILLIVSDDHGYGDWGDALKDASMPNLDRLAASGIHFTQGYVSAPICSASRLGLLTGCYQQRLGNFWYGDGGMATDEFVSMPEILREAGYATAMIGKVHLPGVQHARNFPLHHGFDYFYGFEGAAKHYLQHNAAAHESFQEKLLKYHPEKKGYPIVFNQPMQVNDSRKDQEGFSTELFGEQARKFMAQADEKPFFVQLSFNAVHDQTYQLPPEYLKERGIKPIADWDPAMQDPNTFNDKALLPDCAEARDYLLGQLNFLDIEIGRILDFLDERGLRRNTLVVYVSDNGGSLANGSFNTPLAGGKFTLFEGGIRVPFIISQPGTVQQGMVCSNLVTSLDLLPTFASTAGVAAPELCDGLDLTPLLTGTDLSVGHQTLFWDVGQQFAVRAGDWKLRFSETTGRSRSPAGLGFQLTNLQDDPGEKQNRIEEEPEKAAELMKLYRHWRAGLE